MTVTLKKEAYASMTLNGKVHKAQALTGDFYLIPCRGFAPIHKSKLHFTDSKPDCKACLKLKQR